MAFNPLDVNSWARFVQDFDNTSRLFADQFGVLQRLAPFVRTQSPAIQARYNSLITRGSHHQATLATLGRLRNEAGQWLAGMNRAVSGAVNASMSWLRERFGLAGMGAVPVIIGVAGVAAAGAAIVVIANWIREAFMFSQEMNAIYRLVETGMTPQQAAEQVRRTRVSTSNPLGIPWHYLILGAAVLVLGPPLLSMIRERRS
jgi:hypothetical protein